LIFAKPPGGFRWTETPDVAARVDGAEERWPRLRERWNAVKERLIHTAARDGLPVKIEAGLFTVQFPPAEEAPGLNLVYRLKGDTLTVLSVMFDGAEIAK
jgi:hypothetical protein